MKIAYIIPSLKYTAPNVIASHIIEKAKEHKIDIEIFYLKETAGKKINIDGLIPKKIELKENIIFDNFDIIHSMGFRPDLYLWKKKITRKIKKSKIVSTLHSEFDKDLQDLYGWKGRLIAFLWWLILSNFDHRVFINNHQLNSCKLLKNKKNNHIIYNGIEIPFQPKQIPIKENKKLLYCGVIRKIKGFDLLIKAFHLLDDIKISVAGNGGDLFYRECISHIKNKNMEDRFIFIGHSENIHTIYKDHDILIVPSRSDSFALVVPEAISNGLKVICSDIPPFKELYSSLPVVFFKNGDPKDLAEKLKDVLNGKYSFKNYENVYIYNKDKMTSKYIELYIKAKNEK